MTLIDISLAKQGKVVDCILVKSFDEYKNLGGQRDAFDIYSKIKADAKERELRFIQAFDMSLSGFNITPERLAELGNIAQAFWNLLALWFGKPARKVSFTDFDLEEFNRL